ncbi:dual specificity protein phosphatase PHS1 isoform X2 [Tanacetum coccineum]
MSAYTLGWMDVLLCRNQVNPDYAIKVSEKEEEKSLSAMGMINVVRTVWLEDCECQKKELPVHHRHVAYGLLLPKYTTSSNKGSRHEVLDWIHKGGDEVVETQGVKNVNYTVESHGVQCSLTQFSSVPNVFSHWIQSCLQYVIATQGVVFFALFNHKESGEFLPKETTTVIKITSSRMATQSEQLGCEFAKWLGVRSPQARVIHNCSPEWLKIKEAA